MLESVYATTDLDLISYFKTIPDARMRRGVRIPAWYLLLADQGSGQLDNSLPIGVIHGGNGR